MRESKVNHNGQPEDNRKYLVQLKHTTGITLYVRSTGLGTHSSQSMVLQFFLTKAILTRLDNQKRAHRFVH